MRVSEIMHEVKAIGPDATLKEAANLMSEEGIGSLVISKGRQVLGILTERDVLRNVGRLNEKVEKIMSKNVVTIDDDKNIDKAVEIMKENKIKRLPVKRDGELVGIITVTDILANSDSINEDFLFE